MSRNDRTAGEFMADISRHVWETKYRYADRGTGEQSIRETWRRIARALAAVEPKDSAVWEDRFRRTPCVGSKSSQR
jgi:hypothetical protein